MRRLLVVLLAVAGAAALMAANPAPPMLTAPHPTVGSRRTFTAVVNLTCPSAGTTGYKLTATSSECEVGGEAAYLCAAPTCADGGGVRMGVGSRRRISFDQSPDGGVDGGPTTDVSCWSASGTATITCTPLY